MSNLRKHGVDFQEACDLFEPGVDFIEIFDEEHSEHEERFIAIGPIRIGIIVVVWTERDEGAIRLISARQATNQERELYTRYMEGMS